MADLDPVAALRSRLSTLDREQLLDLAVELSRTYVIEGLGTLSAGTLDASRDLVGEETFAGMLRRIKRDKPQDPVLERFIINGEHIQVKTPMGNVDVTEYRRAETPARPQPSAPPPAVPTPRDSIYNRELQPPAPGARPAQPAARPAPASPPPAAQQQPAARPAAAQPAPAAQPAKDQKGVDRIRLIELD